MTFDRDIRKMVIELLELSQIAVVNRRLHSTTGLMSDMAMLRQIINQEIQPPQLRSMFRHSPFDLLEHKR